MFLGKFICFWEFSNVFGDVFGKKKGGKYAKEKLQRKM